MGCNINWCMCGLWNGKSYSWTYIFTNYLLKYEMQIHEQNHQVLNNLVILIEVVVLVMYFTGAVVGIPSYNIDKDTSNTSLAVVPMSLSTPLPVTMFYLYKMYYFFKLISILTQTHNLGSRDDLINVPLEFLSRHRIWI